jgi:hypothetical protein
MNFNFQLTFTYVLLVFHKRSLIKSGSPFKDLSSYIIEWSHVDRCKLCINLKSVNSAVLEWLKLRDKKHGTEVIFSSTSSSNWFKGYWGAHRRAE